MLDGLFDGKNRELMRNKTIATFLDNFIKSKYGHLDGWGPRWRQKSLYDVISFFHGKEENPDYKSKLGKITVKMCQSLKEDCISVEHIYTLLYCAYYDREPPAREIGRLHREFNRDMFFRGLKNKPFRWVKGRYKPYELHELNYDQPDW